MPPPRDRPDSDERNTPAPLGRRAGGRRERFRPDQVIAALRRAGGSATRAARLLGCNQSTVSRYVQRHPSVRAAYEAARPSFRTVEDIVQAVRQSRGDKREVARRLGVGVRTVNRYIQRHPEVQAAFDAALEPLVELVSWVLDTTDGNVLRAARRLGWSRGRLRSLIARQPGLQAALAFYGTRHPGLFVHPPKEVAQSLLHSQGNCSATARSLGCDRRTLRRFIRSSPDLEEMWQMLRDERPAAREAALARGVAAGHPASIRAVLTHYGADRGYGRPRRPRRRRPPVPRLAPGEAALRALKADIDELNREHPDEL